MFIEVRTDEEVRWQRLKDRDRAGDPTEKSTFLAQERTEAQAEDEAGQALDATASLADIIVINDGTIDDLERKLEDIWSDISRPF